MKNRIFTVTASQLNSGNPIVINNIPIEYTIDTYSQDNNKKNYYYPKELIIPNYSGRTIGFNLFSSEAEYNEYLTDSTYFDLIRVFNNSTYTSLKIPKVEKIVIVGITGTASYDLIVECINYLDI